MTATYTFDVFCSLDGFGSNNGDWGGYWGKQGPELLDHRLALYDQEQRSRWLGRRAVGTVAFGGHGAALGADQVGEAG